VVSYLKSQTDASDFRVNKIQAYAFPTSSSYVIKGGKYSAQIVLSAVDSTLPAQYIVNGNNVPGGKYDVICNNVGTQKFSGQIQINRNGSSISYPFSQEYTVGMPQATVSNSDLNVVYRGIDNKFDIAVPGVAASQVVVTVEGGTATKTGDGKYNVRASRDGEIVIVVSATIEGKPTPMGRSPFRVKYLPDPKSFLQYTDAGGVVRQIQDASISKKLLRTGSIIASYGQDELVKANFEIISFNMVTDATGSASSSGSSLSSKQLSDIDKLEGGDNIMFKNIKAKGPDGKVRELPAVIVKL
jgi:gliding motility-associated protein GldM